MKNSDFMELRGGRGERGREREREGGREREREREIEYDAFLIGALHRPTLVNLTNCLK